MFPILAKRIPKFAHDTEGGHVGSHKAIHDGTVDPMFTAYNLSLYQL